jgi:hypothetical protein
LPPSVPDCEVWPQADVVVVVVVCAEFTVRPMVTDWVCTGLLESLTLNVSAVALAGAVGVPVIAPVDAFNDRPAGSVPEVNDQV